MKTNAFQFVEDHRQEMLDFWKEIVHMESESADKAGVDAVALRLQQFADQAGGLTRIIEMENAGNMLVGEFGPGRSNPGVLFMGHMDTVFPRGTVAKRPFTIKEGIAYGPGALDMKGGITALFFAILALNDAGYSKRPIKFLLAGDEETGHTYSDTAEHFIRESNGHVAAFNCDTGFANNGIVVGRKGTAEFVMEVKGVAVHPAYEPQKGRSSILEIAHKIIDIEKLSNLETGITFNVGVIQGGTVKNSVPDYAKILVDIRYIDPSQKVEIKKMIEKVALKTYIEGTTTTISFTEGIPPMQTTPGVKRLFDIVRKSYQENGWGTPYELFVGGGSDSAYSVISGVPTVCSMGVKGGLNHSVQEFAIVESLFERTKLLIACVLNLDVNEGN